MQCFRLRQQLSTTNQTKDNQTKENKMKVKIIARSKSTGRILKTVMVSNAVYLAMIAHNKVNIIKAVRI